MEILVKAAQLLLSLSILVILHELGHFVFAKLFKTRVEKFYLFFDPWFSLFKYKKGDTEYGIGWIPLGGYVKISGMIDESMDIEQMKQPAQPYEFRAKPSYQRLLIMLGGVTVNFILALFIYASILYVWGEEYLPTKNVKYGIMCDSLALNMGLKNGDKIISVDKKEVENFAHITQNILLNSAKTIEVLRNDSVVSVNIPESLIPALIKTPYFITPRFPFFADDFMKDSPAKAAGIKKGDKIVKINSDSIVFFDQCKAILARNKNQPVLVEVLRDGKIKAVTVKVNENGLLGIRPKGDLAEFFELKEIKYSFLASIPAGINRGFSTISNYLKQFKLIFNRKTKAYESLGGFITIGRIFPGVWDWQSFWSLTAFLSIILAVMNLLPIPGLDGGHVLFLLYEMVTGRRPSDKFLEYAQIVGMIFIFALLIYANGNDIVKLFK
jgi:regulator of sigma E protease